MPATSTQIQHNKVTMPITIAELLDLFSVMVSSGVQKIDPSYLVRMKKGLGHSGQQKHFALHA
jgi:hypothetical protein